MIKEVIEFLNGFAEPIRILTIGVALYIWIQLMYNFNDSTNSVLIAVVLLTNRKGGRHEKNV